MIIRVDKCKTFGIQKQGTTAVQFLPKLQKNNSVIPPVKINEQFTYRGRHFNFQMDDEEHKSTLTRKCREILTDIDKLPLHPKHKIELYSRYLLSKISWDLTVADLGMTWVKQNLDNISCSYLRKWLEIPINGTLDVITLSKKRFGLDLIKVSTKFIQCQNTRRNCLKKSPNHDVRFLHQAKAETNIQYDTHENTKEVIKAVRSQQIARISDELEYQGYIVKLMRSQGSDIFKNLWTETRDILPANIYNFTVRYLNNTLPTLKNMTMWGKASSDICLASDNIAQSLMHVVSGCKVHRQQGRYTWRHNSILANITKVLVGLKDVEIYADLPGYNCPTSVTKSLKRPDLIQRKENVVVVELTCGVMTKVRENGERKQTSYNETLQDLKARYNNATFANLSMSALGLISKNDSGQNLSDTLTSIGVPKVNATNVIRTAINICIRSIYYLFCKKDKDWLDPDLLIF